MDRRLLLGGFGALGAVAVGAYFQAGSRRSAQPSVSTAPGVGTTARPAVVFVGHEL